MRKRRVHEKKSKAEHRLESTVATQKPPTCLGVGLGLRVRVRV